MAPTPDTATTDATTTVATHSFDGMKNQTRKVLNAYDTL